MKTSKLLIREDARYHRNAGFASWSHVKGTWTSGLDWFTRFSGGSAIAVTITVCSFPEARSGGGKIVGRDRGVLILNPADISSGAAQGWVARLERELGANGPAMRKARVTTEERRASLRSAFEGKIAADTSLVVFGSIAREEMTSVSDADWILLVDGQAQPEHSEQRHTIASELVKLGFPEPGRSGVFGRMIGSHDIVHEIGGEDDTNSNTTRRVLLLLESLPVGNREAYDRVSRQILKRYLNDDRGLTRSSSAIRVPRFLLNDLTRYWRTVTVDFVYKQRAEAGDK